MPGSKIFFAVLLVLLAITTSAQKKAVAHFDKVIVSPYIQVTFVQGEEESVTIDNINVDQSKLHI
jgi:spore coat protein CotH